MKCVHWLVYVSGPNIVIRPISCCDMASYGRVRCFCYYYLVVLVLLIKADARTMPEIRRCASKLRIVLDTVLVFYVT